MWCGVWLFHRALLVPITPVPLTQKGRNRDAQDATMVRVTGGELQVVLAAVKDAMEAAIRGALDSRRATRGVISVTQEVMHSGATGVRRLGCRLLMRLSLWAVSCGSGPGCR
jgi:hypothetical protein